LSQGDALGWDNGAPLALGPVLAEDWIGKLGWQREGRASGAEARVDFDGFMRGLNPPPPSAPRLFPMDCYARGFGGGAVIGSAKIFSDLGEFWSCWGWAFSGWLGEQQTCFGNDGQKGNSNGGCAVCLPMRWLERLVDMRLGCGLLLSHPSQGREGWGTQIFSVTKGRFPVVND
jgi:hypothetical protein